MRDMADSQTEDGLIPNIAPEFTKFDGTFRAAAEWGCALILVPWQQYQFTGDTSLMREYYGEMQKYMEYLASKANGHIIDEGLGDWYDLGPADRPGFAQLTPPPITATAFYYYDAHIMSQIAGLLGKDEDAAKYTTARRRNSRRVARQVPQCRRRHLRHQLAVLERDRTGDGAGRTGRSRAGVRRVGERRARPRQRDDGRRRRLPLSCCKPSPKAASPT